MSRVLCVRVENQSQRSILRHCVSQKNRLTGDFRWKRDTVCVRLLRKNSASNFLFSFSLFRICKILRDALSPEKNASRVFIRRAISRKIITFRADDDGEFIFRAAQIMERMMYRSLLPPWRVHPRFYALLGISTRRRYRLLSAGPRRNAEWNADAVLASHFFEASAFRCISLGR